VPLTISKAEALYQLLFNGPNIAPLVGESIFPIRRPEGAEAPLIEFMQVSGFGEQAHTGDGVDWPRFQISCWGNTPDEAREIGEAVKLDVVGHRYTYGDLTISVLKLDEREDKDDNTNRFRRIVDVAVY
jgi:hypothetical protein